MSVDATVGVLSASGIVWRSGKRSDRRDRLLRRSDMRHTSLTRYWGRRRVSEPPLRPPSCVLHALRRWPSSRSALSRGVTRASLRVGRLLGWLGLMLQLSSTLLPAPEHRTLMTIFILEYGTTDAHYHILIVGRKFLAANITAYDRLTLSGVTTEFV